MNVQAVAVQQGELDLGKLVITAPFACRIGQVNLQRDQFIAAGQLLFEVSGTAQAEVEAQFPIRELRKLLSGEQREQLGPGLEMETLRALFDVDATVHARPAAASWAARFHRIRETVDPQTREMPVVVVVDKPYARSKPGERPPLAQGMFCEVELVARHEQSVIVLPRSASPLGRSL